MARPRRSMREIVTRDTITQMLDYGNEWNDVPAIREISNNIIDNLLRSGEFSVKEANRLSQDVTIKEVQAGIKEETKVSEWDDRREIF